MRKVIHLVAVIGQNSPRPLHLLLDELSHELVDRFGGFIGIVPVATDFTAQKYLLVLFAVAQKAPVPRSSRIADEFADQTRRLLDVARGSGGLVDQTPFPRPSARPCMMQIRSSKYCFV